MRRNSRSVDRSIEPLESRQLLSAPHVISVIPDNRGEVIITLDQAVVASTVNSHSVQLATVGPDLKFATSDDVHIVGRVRWVGGSHRITFKTDQLGANTTYSVKLSAKLIKNGAGEKLDGEFNGAGVISGDGVAAGDFYCQAKKDKGINPVARFTTSVGAMNVKLFRDKTPITVANFEAYSNAAVWDGTIIHRAARLGDNSPFVIQGGGFGVNASNTIVTLPHNVAIKNEPVVSNTRGTISMAKLGSPTPEFPDPVNSATNQWFFNEQDNSHNSASLDTQNGGFTAFGAITNASGFAVMDGIGGLPTKDLRSGQNDGTVAMDEAPVLNPNATATNLNPSADLVVIRRIAILNKVAPIVIG